MCATPVERLKAFPKEKDFFIGIDSDGCAFDSMEIKQKECFIPSSCREWNLQPIAKYAREAAEFVNLYSKTRGINRFPAMMRVFDLLMEWPDVQARGYQPPDLAPLREWMEREPRLSENTLREEVGRNPNPTLQQALRWSEAVNQAVADMVHGVPPFPGVRESLEKAREKADLMVVSATPIEALEKEWAEHNIAQFVGLIAGQEMGSKKEHLQTAAEGKYPENHILMVGDAPGDRKAAEAINALFYPINPGREEASWQRFLGEGLDRFFSNTFAGEFQKDIVAEFEALLPENPPWQK